MNETAFGPSSSRRLVLALREGTDPFGVFSKTDIRRPFLRGDVDIPVDGRGQGVATGLGSSTTWRS